MSYWFLGYFVSVVVGGVVVEGCWRWGRQCIGMPPYKRKGVSPWVTGVVERLFFTLAAAIDPSTTIPAMIGWLAIKMAANWERAPESDPFHRSGAVLAAVLGLISMGFALGGGLICKLGIPS